VIYNPANISEYKFTKLPKNIKPIYNKKEPPSSRRPLQTESNVVKTFI